MERIRSPKFSKPVFTCGEGVRFATPEVVASYRAGRLKCGVLAGGGVDELAGGGVDELAYFTG
jgi:hypothetical protein